jgi:phosphatidylinositol-4-phosphate 3-kinase
LRKLAVESLKMFLKNEELILYLPQLLQAIKYEYLNNSALAKMLLECASKNIRFAHRLYW